MKILCINKFFYLYGGCERYMFGLNQILEEAEHEISHFSMQHPLNFDSRFSDYFVSNIDFFDHHNSVSNRIKAASRVIYSFEARRKLANLVNTVQPDIAHLHNIAHQLSPSILATLHKSGIPIIHTLHDYKLVCPIYTMYQNGAPCEKCLGGAYHHVVTNRCNRGSLAASSVNGIEMYLHRILGSYQYVDMFIAPSKFLYRKVIESGISAERVTQLPLFIDASTFTPRYDHDGYILYFGQLISVKGVDLLLEAVTRFPALPIVIAGRGHLQDELQQYAEQHQLNVRFAGFQSGTALAELIRGAMVVVVPSRWYENQPFAILEAFAYGKPVIAARLGGMQELIQEYETGLLFEADSAEDLAKQLHWIIHNNAQLATMGEKARLYVEDEFSPTHHYTKLYEIYRRFA